jgi:hypothetical protein
MEACEPFARGQEANAHDDRGEETVNARGTYGTGTTSASKKSAGDGLMYIANFLQARGQIGGVTFTVPASASAIETFKAMRNAQSRAWGLSGGYPHAPTGAELIDICRAWLDAYAGACTRDHGGVTGDIFSATAYNLSMLRQRLNGTPIPPTGSFEVCANSNWSKLISPLGTAVCELRGYLASLAAVTTFTQPFLAEVYTRVERLATELDAADFAVAGQRASDALTGLPDIPAGIASAWELAKIGIFGALAIGGVIALSNVVRNLKE